MGQRLWGTSAYVTQFDVNTGPRTFHANLGSRYGERVEFEVKLVSDSALYEGVGFDWYAIWQWCISYDTTLGGRMTIPSFTLFWYYA